MDNTMPTEKSPGTRALILLARLVCQVEDATKGSPMLRGLLNSSAEAKEVLVEARAILAAAQKEPVR